MTLNYWMMAERYPYLKEEVGGSIIGYEISSLLDKMLAFACQPYAMIGENRQLVTNEPVDFEK